MRDYVVMTDSDTEIPYSFADSHNLPVFLMPYTLDGNESLFDLGRTTDFKQFYTRLREGAEATTATRPPTDIQAFFEEIIKTDKDILYVCFSSQLSAHYELSKLAREKALENYPDANIVIVDSKAIAMGAGILVYHAVRLKEEGASLIDNVEWLESNKLRIHHYFTADSLDYLKRTGRLSAITAKIGTILDLKPVLTLTCEGKIIAFERIKGRRKVSQYLAERTLEAYASDDISKMLCVVCHGDNVAQASEVKRIIEEKLDFKEVWFMDVGPVIGCHIGPGVVGVLFFGTQRTF